MSTPTFRLADPVADRAALLDINLEYVGWVFAQIEAMSGMTARDILGADVVDYVPTVIDKVCGDPPPRGAFYLVEHEGHVVAMGGVRRSGEGVAELKRVYVRPAGRGQRLGEALTRRLVADARAFGYRTLRLDTLPFMGAAQAVYEAMGFVDCAPYPVEMTKGTPFPASASATVSPESPARFQSTAATSNPPASTRSSASPTERAGPTGIPPASPIISPRSAATRNSSSTINTRNPSIMVLLFPGIRTTASL